MATITRPSTTALVATLALLIGLVVGSRAIGQDRDRGDMNLTERIQEELHAQRLVPIVVQPPVVQLNNDCALVGASDGFYYIVTRTETIRVQEPDRRFDLAWR